MSTALKLIEQSFNTTHQSLHMTSQHVAKRCQYHQADTPRRSTEKLKQLFGKDRGKARWEELHSHRPFGHKMRSLESRIQQKIKKNQCQRERYTSNR